jgi:hypothetical protein
MLNQGIKILKVIKKEKVARMFHAHNHCKCAHLAKFIQDLKVLALYVQTRNYEWTEPNDIHNVY